MTRITRGTTNVFADLGYPDAAERQTKLGCLSPTSHLRTVERLVFSTAACYSGGSAISGSAQATPSGWKCLRLQVSKSKPAF